MRQVPHYLLIGNGRVARHFQCYFSALQLSYSTWHRGESLTLLQSELETATHCIFLISDKAINDFITQHALTFKGVRIHCSGSLVTDLAYGVHPLYAFNAEHYTLEQYRAIPFILDDDAPSFENVLPNLPNAHARIAKSDKAKYHALSVMAGNFSCLLWQKLFSTFQHELKLSPDIAHAYLRQNTENLVKQYETALTGPLTRNDQETLQKNMLALNADPFQSVYQSFVTCYQAMQSERGV